MSSRQYVSRPFGTTRPKHDRTRGRTEELQRLDGATPEWCGRGRDISVIAPQDRKVSYWRDYLDPLRVFAALEGRELT